MVNRFSAHSIQNGGQIIIDFKKKSDFSPQVSGTLIRKRYLWVLWVLSKHKLECD